MSMLIIHLFSLHVTASYKQAIFVTYTYAVYYPVTFIKCAAQVIKNLKKLLSFSYNTKTTTFDSQQPTIF